MRQGNYKFANHCVRIESIYEDVHLMCCQYRANEQPEYEIQIKQEDLLFEKKRANQDDETFTDGYYETLAVYRKLCDWLIDQDVLLFHGSAVGVDENAYLFTATSGTGKSTHTKMWREVLGNRAVMINDDKPLLYIGTDKVVVYGTPWDGKHHLSSNCGMKLKGLCVLKRGQQNQIWHENKREIYPMLIQQSFHSNHPEKMKKILELVERLTNIVNCYGLECNPTREAAWVSYSMMKKNR